MKKVMGLLLVQLSILLGSGGAAWAAPPDNVRFFVTGRVEDPSATIIASGAISGIGTLTAESVDYRRADHTYHETDLVAVGGGTLTMSVDGRFDVWPFTLDPRTCTRRGTLTGTWTVTAGGGHFVGATGSGTFSGRFLTYANRTQGGCDEESLKGFLVGPMAGNVSFQGKA